MAIGRTSGQTSKNIEELLTTGLQYIYLPSSPSPSNSQSWTVEKNKYYYVLFTNTAAETEANPLTLSVTNADIIASSNQVRSKNGAGEYAKKWLILTKGTTITTTVPNSLNRYGRFLIL